MSDKFMSDECIATIAASYASRPDVSADQILDLIARLRGTTDATPRTAASIATPAAFKAAEPAIAVEKSMTNDTIFCLCCGKGFKMLKRHLGAEHGLSEQEYRAMFGLSADVALVAPSYSKRKADYAKRAGLGKYSRSTQGKDAEIS